MKNLFARLFRKETPEDWRLVHTMRQGWKRTSNVTGEVTSKGDIYYHLFESDRGNRYVAMASSDFWAELSAERITAETWPQVLRKIEKSYNQAWQEREIAEYALTHTMWNETIYPWLAGRNDPEIPTWESIPRREFRDNLAGKKVP